MVEKVSPNGELKQEMILVCNSIRNDLLHPNEYIRGRTLRMLMRVMHIGILEPLKPSILENITHTCPYVRRNCVALLYKIYLKFNGNKQDFNTYYRRFDTWYWCEYGNPAPKRIWPVYQTQRISTAVHS